MISTMLKKNVKLYKTPQQPDVLIYCFRYADQVSVGDEVAIQKDDQLLPVRVVNISSITMSGNWDYLLY